MNHYEKLRYTASCIDTQYITLPFSCGYFSVNQFMFSIAMRNILVLYIIS